MVNAVRNVTDFTEEREKLYRLSSLLHSREGGSLNPRLHVTSWVSPQTPVTSVLMGVEAGGLRELVVFPLAEKVQAIDSERERETLPQRSRTK